MAASDAGATIDSSTSTASCWTMRTFSQPAARRCAAAARRRRADGPRCRRSRRAGAAAAIAAVALPMPKPISTASGATRPNTARSRPAAATNGNDEARRQRRERACLPGPIRPARTTKLRMRGGGAAPASSGSGVQLSLIDFTRRASARARRSLPIIAAAGGCSSMVERQLPKLHTRVRFPSPAPKTPPIPPRMHLLAQ